MPPISTNGVQLAKLSWSDYGSPESLFPYGKAVPTHAVGIQYRHPGARCQTHRPISSMSGCFLAVGPGSTGGLFLAPFSFLFSLGLKR